MNFGSSENTGTGAGTGSNPLSKFTSGTSGSGSSETIGSNDFMKSNSLVARIAFLLLVLFGFVVLLRIGIGILGYFYGPKSSPKLIDGMVDASQLMIIEQDPSAVGAKTGPRSVNANDGIEFTWSCWIFINNLNDNGGKYRCVFYKGNDFASGVDEPAGINFPNNAPGLYIAPDTNDLVIFMNTFNVINEEITINNIPLNKWFNVILRCQNTTLDVYINGTITKSEELHGVPKQNYGNVYVGMNGGFSGYISNLWYYDYALGTSEIQKLVTNGPNTSMSGNTSMSMKNPNYLSLRWFFFGANDGYNP
jgi:hypothetical protein